MDLYGYILYLDEPPSFSGGSTVFEVPSSLSSDGPVREPGGVDMAAGGEAGLFEYTPQLGALIVFDHKLWHWGATVTAGIKRVLRSDVVYRAVEDEEPTAATAPRRMQLHHGYVWSLLSLKDGRVASACRDCTVKVWWATAVASGGNGAKDALVLRGHSQSPMGLAEVPSCRAIDSVGDAAVGGSGGGGGDGGSSSSNLLVSVARDASARVWSLTDGRCLQAIEDAHGGAAGGEKHAVPCASPVALQCGSGDEASAGHGFCLSEYGLFFFFTSEPQRGLLSSPNKPPIVPM